jgi:hypothetical protein
MVVDDQHGHAHTEIVPLGAGVVILEIPDMANPDGLSLILRDLGDPPDARRDERA